MQIGLMDTAKDPQIRAQRRSRSFACVAMHLAFPVTIVIARPLKSTVAHRSICRMTSGITVGFISIKHGAPNRNVFVDQFVAGALIGMVTDPKAMFAGLARDQMNNRRAIVGIGAPTGLLIGPSPWRVGLVAMGCTFFPVFW